MKTMKRVNSVSFTVKGQVVIPRWLRKQYEIEKGTRATVTSTAEGILLKPVTRAYIRGLRGSLKGSKAMEVLMAERRRERAL